MLAVAYGTAAPSIGVAEFAPAARQAVEPPPTTDEPGAARTGGGGARRPAPTTTLPPTTSGASDASAGAAPTTRMARTRECVGTPPRQTEDPMSPPCIGTIFDGDNGGGTTAGVSGTEIRVAVPAWASFSTAASHKAHLAAVHALFEHVNSRFELYGRRLVPVIVEGSATAALEARALAADVASRQVFATVTGVQEWGYGSEAALVAELTRLKVLTVARGANNWWSNRALYDPVHPYLWSVYPASEDVQANLGEVACTVLASLPAQHAGDAPLRSKPRRFGVVAMGRQTVPPATVVSDALAACTGQPALRLDITSANGSTALRTGLSRLQADGATTLICICEPYTSRSVIDTSHGVGFHPEWILTPMSGGTGYDENFVQDLRQSGQVAPPLRLSAAPKLLPVQARPSYKVIQSTRPDLLQFAGSSYDLYGVLGMGEFLYDQLLVLAAGIQGAGPQITADTFAAALMSTTFPNPGAGQAPSWQPSVGFGPGDHAFYNDYQLSWWSDTAPSLDPISPRATGSWCYLDQGARFRVGSYPMGSAARLFNAEVACR